MSRCCGNDSRRRNARSGPLAAAMGVLRRWLWLVITLLVVAIAWIWFTFGPGKDLSEATVSTAPTATERVVGPRIEFDETYLDLGQVPVDEDVEHTFTYRNIGTEPLVLQKEVLATADEGC